MKNFKLLNYVKSHSDKELIEKFYGKMEDYFDGRNKADHDLTDHGIQHISNVMENAYRILENKPFELFDEDYIYLIQSIIIHDLALWGRRDSGRKDHHKRIYIKLEETFKNDPFLEPNIKDKNRIIISRIAAAHSGNAQDAYDSIKDDISITSNNDPHILFLSMLLRISDELDITQDRIQGYDLKMKLKNMNRESQKHWIKHQSIIEWKILPNDRSCIQLYLKPNINDILLTEYNLQFSKEEYMDFMCEQINKLEKELKTIFDICLSKGHEANWHLHKLSLIKHYDPENNDSDYINELNEMLEYRRKNNTENKKSKDVYNIDDPLRNEHMEKKEKNIKEIYITSNINNSNYTRIGGDKYRKKLNYYIKKNSMLKPGCYNHQNSLKIFTWLDCFRFHQDNFLLHITSNIMIKDIEKRCNNLKNNYFIIGLGLKGSKIATITALRLEIPVYFFVDNDMRIKNLEENKKYNVIMITDCIITGKTAFSCDKKLKESGINFNIKGVYSVFIRKSAKNGLENNELIKNNIPIYSINDTYSYTDCPYKEKKDCPLYQSYGDKCYEKVYKL